MTNPFDQAIETAAQLWAGEPELPSLDENEYVRGQVELIADLFGSPDLEAQEFGGDSIKISVWETLKDKVKELA